MLNKSHLHDYQLKAIDHIINVPKGALFLDMGLGKTISTLTAISYLIYDNLEVGKVLIIAPKRVAENVWTSELDKWTHIKRLRISKIVGNEKKRLEALNAKADIYTVSRDNIVWLCSQFGGTSLPFDMIVIDELSSFKSPKSLRFKALRRCIGAANRVVGLTGTPAPNGLIDLWSQMYLIDSGQRLFQSLTRYRDAFFTKKYSGWGYDITDYGKERIPELIKDVVISMKKEDYLNMEEPIINDIEVEFTPDILRQYNEFERESVLEIFGNNEEITATNAAALRSKLLQFSNGAIYDSEKKVIDIHNIKLDALEEIVEEANGKPVLVAYSFQHDRDKILSKFKGKAVLLDGEKTINDWNAGKIDILVMHPASGGHGLNLQSGGNTIVWYGLNDSLELYEQFNARLHRQGQDQVVIINRILVKGTQDFEVKANLDRKAAGQNGLMAAVKALIGKYLKRY